MYNYQPELSLSLDYCQQRDCGTIIFNDNSEFFLDYGINWLKITKVEIDIYLDDELVSSNDVTNQFKTSLSGTLSTNGTTNALSGSGTSFESEISTEDYVELSSGKYYKVSSVTTDTAAVLNTIPEDANSGVGYKLSTQYTLDSSAFGAASGDSIPDGIYEITYRVTYDYTWDDNGDETNVTDETSEFTQIVPLYCNVNCCVKKKIVALMDNAECCIESQDVIDAMQAWAWLQSLVYQGGCGNVTELSNTLSLLQAYCIDTPCNC